ncbi:hypothetical protein AGMMS50212_16790 [Spirochaetia bacterium]|nr:hypothetical protein AGMMS50212_16790 [Spirochaetia bacterium]
MTVEQTVDIPANHRLTIEVPREVPAGRTILTFTPDSCPPVPDGLDIGIDSECPLDHTPNAVTIAAMEEGDAMLRGEIPVKRYKSVDEFWEDLDL